MAPARAEQVDLDQRGVVAHRTHAPTATTDGLRLAASVNRGLRAALVPTGEAKGEGSRHHPIVVETLDAGQISLANLSAMARKRIAQPLAGGGVLGDDQAAAGVEVDSMSKAAFIEICQLGTRLGKPRLNRRTVASILTYRVNPSRLGQHEPGRGFVQNGDRCGRVLGVHGGWATVPDMADSVEMPVACPPHARRSTLRR